jgi:para-nitrobenzyl esterase
MYWVNFTKSGDPNRKGLPEWKPYNNNTSEILEIGEHTGMIPITKNEDQLKFLGIEE